MGSLASMIVRERFKNIEAIS